jgi:hypothetical protein
MPILGDCFCMGLSYREKQESVRLNGENIMIEAQ